MRRAGRILVELFSKRAGDLLHLLHAALHPLDVFSIPGGFEPVEGVLEAGPVLLGELVLVLLEKLLALVDQSVNLVLQVDLLPGLAILIGMRLGVGLHLVDLFIGEAAGRFDPNLLLLTAAEILGRNVENTVGIDIEGNLDLGNSPGRWRQSIQVEPVQQAIVVTELALPLEDLDLDPGLIVCGGRIDLFLGRRDGRIALDEIRHDPSEGLDP